MNIDSGSEALAALGHPGRLAVFRLLARRVPHGARPSDIADALGLKANTLSVYVSTLTRAGLLTTWRNGRSVYYSVDLDRFGDLIGYLVNDCCHGRPELCVDVGGRATAEFSPRNSAPYHVLFVCTGNSARSIFAEALLNRIGEGRFVAHSAGTDPFERVNPGAVRVLEASGFDVSKYTSKSIDRFFGAHPTPMDFVFTVCDRAADEETSPWPGRPMIAHWGIPDPVGAVNDNPESAFEAAYQTLEEKVTRLANLPLDELGAVDRQNALDDIGRDLGDRGGLGSGVGRRPDKRATE